MSALELPLMLKLAGCRLVVEGRALIVLDRDSAELERGTRGRWEWLCAASAAAQIERWADALGLGHELHGQHLQMRFWQAGEDPEATPWRPFAAALAWLAEVEAARVAAAAKRLTAAAQRWLAWFAPLLGVLLQGVCWLRGLVRRRVVQIVGRAGMLGLIERGLSASWVWAAGRGPPG